MFKSCLPCIFQKAKLLFCTARKIVLNIFGGFKCTKSGEFRAEINLFVNLFFIEKV